MKINFNLIKLIKYTNTRSELYLTRNFTNQISLKMSESNNNNNSNASQKETLALPSTEDSKPTELQIDQTIKLEELGPMVINEDGTMSRVNNWSEMSEFEKKSFNRLILKRNKERLEKLKARGVEPN